MQQHIFFHPQRPFVTIFAAISATASLVAPTSQGSWQASPLRAKKYAHSVHRQSPITPQKQALATLETVGAVNGGSVSYMDRPWTLSSTTLSTNIKQQPVRPCATPQFGNGGKNSYLFLHMQSCQRQAETCCNATPAGPSPVDAPTTNTLRPSSVSHT